jgi:hypothetical protein
VVRNASLPNVFPGKGHHARYVYRCSSKILICAGLLTDVVFNVMRIFVNIADNGPLW